MIKASELRIGNLILDSNYTTENLYKVVSVNLLILSNIGDSNFTYKPIPLTEEWLLKFGFNYRFSPNYLTKEVKPTVKTSRTFYFTQKENVLGVECSLGFQFPIGQMHVMKVHEYQNIFHVLTGEELIIK